LTLRQPTPGLIIRCGGQFFYQRRLSPASTPLGGGQLNRPGNPYGNAQAETGWSTLKMSCCPAAWSFACLEEARLSRHYLDTYFSLDRRHSALGYRSPHQFKQRD
jgi:hypothetical protein